MNNNRTIRPLGPENIEEYLTIYLGSYPAFKDIGDEGRAAKLNFWFKVCHDVLLS